MHDGGDLHIRFDGTVQKVHLSRDLPEVPLGIETELMGCEKGVGDPDRFNLGRKEAGEFVADGEGCDAERVVYQERRQGDLRNRSGTDSLISHKVALEQGNDIFKRLSESPSEFGKVVFEMKERSDTC